MKTIAVSLTAILGAVIPAAQGISGEEEPSFEELLQLNAPTLFGGEATFAKDRVTIVFKKPGQFDRGFQGTGIVNPGTLKEANRKILEKPEGGGEIPDVSVVGRGDGDWLSRFDLSGDVDFTFKIRIPAFQRGSQLFLRMNQTPKSQIQTTFFQEASLLQAGKTRKRAMAPKEFQLPPEQWFNCKAVVPISLTCHDGKFLLRMKTEGEKEREKGREKTRGKAKEKEKPKEPAKDAAKEAPKAAPKDVDLLSLDEAGAAGGKIGFTFRKISFVVSELTVSGTYDRAWCEEQLKQLDKDKKLVRKAEKPPEGQAPQPARKAAKSEGEVESAKKKDAEEDL